MLKSYLKPQEYESLQAEKARRMAVRAEQAGKGGYQPRGSAERLQNLTNTEVAISGPAGTGKSRACLEKLWAEANGQRGLRALILRKTRASLTETGLMTFERDVLGLDHPMVADGPQRKYRTSYHLLNDSEIVVGGMDKPRRILSTEYDLIFVQQAEELQEHEWETLITRLRGDAEYQQIIGDCNPDAPTHWIKQRADRGDLELLESRHEDNPRLWDEERAEWTEEGAGYIAKLDRLTGARKKRMRYGRWVQAEGVVYEPFDRAVHVIDRFEIPEDWRRFRSVDFGFTNPFVCQWWAIDGDGNMYRYREIYHTKRLVSEHAGMINELSADERIETTVCDHDAEDRATLSEKGIANEPAKKAISVGVEKVNDRLQFDPEKGEKPRIYFLRDSVVEMDQELVEAKKPLSTEQEFDGYVWANKANKEVPVKENDHGMDATRYAVMYLDAPLREINVVEL